MRVLSISAAFFLLISSLHSQAISYDTVSSESIAKGVTYTFYKSALPQEIHVAEIDLRNPQLSIESVRHNGLVTTSEEVRKNSSERKNALVAINGDFFSFKDSSPVNNQITGYVSVTGYSSPQKSQLAITAEKKLLIDGFTFSGTVLTKSKSVFTFERLNSTRTLSEITFYTRYRGTTTKTDSGGVEIILRPVSKKITAQDTLRFVVASVSTISGNSLIPEGGGVLSFGRSDTSLKFLSAFSRGDTVRIYMDYKPKTHPVATKIAQLIGGWGRLLDNGKNLTAIADTNEGLTGKFTAVRHPRTFLGINADTTKLYLCIVDGRQEKSVGMTFPEMAHFLHFINVTNAFNFDGGGSSTMVIHGKVVNSPSDASGERPVANSLQVVQVNN
jgi:exopolysaccharide biosynthesis protein